MANAIDLSGLRDIHLPIMPDIFPLALGWWVAIFVFFALAVGLIWLIFDLYYTLYREADKELKEIYNLYEFQSGLFTKELSKLLRRVSIVQFGADKVSKLSETQWADFLVQSAPRILTTAQAKKIAESTYMPPGDSKALCVAELYEAAQNWIKYVLKGAKS